jgi:hypothetical protein
VRDGAEELGQRHTDIQSNRKGHNRGVSVHRFTIGRTFFFHG